MKTASLLSQRYLRSAPRHFGILHVIQTGDFRLVLVLMIGVIMGVWGLKFSFYSGKARIGLIFTSYLQGLANRNHLKTHPRYFDGLVKLLLFNI
jgi:hypothetical protein